MVKENYLLNIKENLKKLIYINEIINNYTD